MDGGQSEQFFCWGRRCEVWYGDEKVDGVDAGDADWFERIGKGAREYYRLV